MRKLKRKIKLKSNKLFFLRKKQQFYFLNKEEVKFNAL